MPKTKQFAGTLAEQTCGCIVNEHPAMIRSTAVDQSALCLCLPETKYTAVSQISNTLVTDRQARIC